MRGGARARSGAPAGPPGEEVNALAAACSVGLLTGLGVSALNLLDEGLLELCEAVRALAGGRGLGAAAIVALPVLGGLGAAGLREIAGGDFGEGGNETAEGEGSLARAAARPWLRAGAAVLTLGTGSSLGPEGPSVDIGRDWARFLDGTALFRGQSARGGVPTTSSRAAPAAGARRSQALVAAGAAAGVAAGFNAAISGVFFALETARPADRGGLGALESAGSSREGEAPLVMVLLAAVVAAVVSSSVLGDDPAFNIPPYSLNSTVVDIPASWLLGLASGGVSVAFLNLERASARSFAFLERDAGVPRGLLPAAGALFGGLLVLARPEIAYRGFANFNLILRGFDGSGVSYGAAALFQIAVLKVVATAVGRGSGLVGGLLAPSLFVGAALGFGFGDLAQPLGLDLGQPALYSLVGMAAVLAGVCRVPLTAALLTFELTQNYSVLVPTLGAVGLSFWVSSAAEAGREKTATQGAPVEDARSAPAAARVPAPPAGLLLAPSLATLEGLPVADVMDASPLLVNGHAPAVESVSALLASAKPVCLVVDGEERLVGAVPLKALQQALAAEAATMAPGLKTQQLALSLGCAVTQGRLGSCAPDSPCLAALLEAAAEAGSREPDGGWSLEHLGEAVPQGLMPVVNNEGAPVGALVVDDIGDALARRAIAKEL